MTARSTVDVVVCGAGVGGLACARALAGLGLDVLVLDRRAAPADVAKGELLQPEAVRILDGWGVLPALLDTGAVPVGRLAIRDPAGAAVLDLDYGALPGRYRQIVCTEYPTVLRVLADALREHPLAGRVELRRPVAVDGPLRDGGGRVVGVRAGGREIGARLVVAADGPSSRLRRAAGVPTRRRPYDHHLIAFDVPGARVAAEVCAYLTDQGLRLVYPLPGGRARLYVQVQASQLRGSLLADLPAWCERLLASMPALEPVAGAVRASLGSRQVLAVYRLRARQLAAPGLALVGEAAHAVHPMAAQGMNSSLADAEALAGALAEIRAETPDAVDRALLRYHDVRLPRLDHTATVSHNAARMLTLTAGAGRRIGRRMMRHTAANPRLLRITAGNLAGVGVHPLTAVDRLYQLGLLTDPAARAAATRRKAPTPGGGAR